MTNNDLLRRLRYTLNYNDKRMIAIFALADREVSREQVSSWLKKEDDPGYERLPDLELAVFLNGLISHKRGKRDGDQPEPERRLNNNMILRKLKIAFDMQAEDILATLAAANLKLSKSELGAFFRKPEHKHYRDCKDQVMRKFIHGLQLKFRPKDPDNTSEPDASIKTGTETANERNTETDIDTETINSTGSNVNAHIWGTRKPK